MILHINGLLDSGLRQKHLIHQESGLQKTEVYLLRKAGDSCFIMIILTKAKLDIRFTLNLSHSEYSCEKYILAWVTIHEEHQLGIKQF